MSGVPGQALGGLIWSLRSTVRAADLQGRPTYLTFGLVATMDGPRPGYRFGPYGVTLVLTDPDAVAGVLSWHQDAADVAQGGSRVRFHRELAYWRYGSTVPAMDAHGVQTQLTIRLVEAAGVLRPVYTFGRYGVTLTLTDPDAVAQAARWHREAGGTA
ncbi:hypothetical protein L3Q67_00895 [Saccharothrix sp. AJ9571]|nr:hypothetical protein L3Q67_00895 [Saccharothrix sp. AJ9571]